MKLSAAIAAAALSAVISSGFSPAAQTAMAGAYTLAPVTYGVQLKTPDGRVVLEYMTKKPENIGLTSPSAACFHPVYTPTGERATNIAPDDHPHHRGIFLAWHDSEFREPAVFTNYPNHPLRGFNIRRADFWGWGEYAPREGRIIQNRDIKLAKADAKHAVIELHNDWNVINRKYLDETTTAAVAERDGVFVIDFQYNLIPLADYFLDRQSFSGFDVQMRKDGESYFANAAGKVTLPDPHYSLPDLDWPSEPWYDYSIKLANGKTVGAAVLDHPLNPSTAWHNSTRLWMINPVITAGAPLTIRRGETFTLRYRVVVHDGDTPTALLQKLSEEWRATK